MINFSTVGSNFAKILIPKKARPGDLGGRGNPEGKAAAAASQKSKSKTYKGGKESRADRVLVRLENLPMKPNSIKS